MAEESAGGKTLWGLRKKVGEVKHAESLKGWHE